MKLTSWSDLVKPDRAVLEAALVATALTMLTLQIVLTVTDDGQARMDRFGDGTARALAELAVEPLLDDDRLHLGVIGNRLAETAEITGVASYSADRELLASTGPVLGPQYTQPVMVDDSVVGYVRVTLDSQAFAADRSARWLGMGLAVLLVPLLVASGWTLARAARSGRLPPLLGQRPRWLTALPGSGSLPSPEPEPVAAPEPAPEVCHQLLAVNLYNQLSLQPQQREFELALCLELAGAVAAGHGGRAMVLPGVGVLLAFPGADHPFDSVCAAFVLNRLLEQEAPFGKYRMGLHRTLQPADQALTADDEAVRDAALLSALAKDGSLAVSAPVAAALDAPECLRTTTLANPLLDELTTSGPDCLVVTSLTAPHDDRVAEEAAAIRAQRDAIVSPSTF